MNCGIVVREFVLQSRYYVHFRANTLGKGMNPLILPPAMGKQQDGLGSSALVRQLVQEKENSEFKPVKLRLKTDLVSYPARAEGLVNSTSSEGLESYPEHSLVGGRLTLSQRCSQSILQPQKEYSKALRRRATSFLQRIQLVYSKSLPTGQQLFIRDRQYKNWYI